MNEVTVKDIDIPFDRAVKISVTWMLAHLLIATVLVGIPTAAAWAMFFLVVVLNSD